jgi:PAS domain S-box-containing protein
MDKVRNYLNPIARLGIRSYSFWFPFIFMMSLSVLSEAFAYGILKDPNSVGVYAIFLFVAFIIYFSFRDGMQGGFIASAITILYYGYIIYTRHYTGQQLSSGIETTIILGVLYFIVAAIIGGLKQIIDKLIEREIDAKNLAEEGQLRLQTILQQLPVGVLLVDIHGYKLEGNRQLEKILGKGIRTYLHTEDNYQSVHAIRGEKPLPPKDWPIVRALKKGEIVTAEEMEYIRNDKKRLFLRVNAAPIRNKNKEIIAAVSTLYDITQEKELELRKDDFVNMASHELKTPITSMKLYIDSLIYRLKKYEDERVLKSLNGIKNQTERLQDLVNDLLDVSRLQTGKLSFTKEEFRIDTQVEEIIEELQGITKQQKIILSKRSPIIVNADKFRIYQVLTNLITNAVKYSEEGKEIHLQVKRIEGKVIVSVKDFGIGIAKDQQIKIFDRLYQVTDSKEKTFPGFGMGLYISKEIIKRHHGNIWVDSEKGKGSTFYFTLPLAKKSK